ncbi:MAG: polymer-forming cytoskeletal protein [Halorhodospira sp.]
MTLESNLHLDGQIKGTIISDHDVSIGNSGRFEGNITAHRLLVSGYVEGVIDCASLEIVAEGRVFGELHSDDFIIEAGGQFLGESHPRREVPLAALQHEDADAARRLSGPRSQGEEPEERSQAPHATPPPQEPAEATAATASRPGPEPQPHPPESDSSQEGAQHEAQSEPEVPAHHEEEETKPAPSRPQPRQTFWGRR